VEAAERAALIERYADGAAEVERAITDIGRRAFDRRPPDGSWSAREVIHHLADSEMTSAIRLRTLLAEDDAVIRGYDEAGYARIFRYADRPIEPALAALRAARSTTLQILRGLDEASWARRGTHTESGPYGVEDWLRIYGAHAHEHADQIRRAGSARTQD
jgi:hypothetical protein